MILENIKTRLELRYHMEEFGYENWGEQVGGSPGGIACLKRSCWTGFVVFKVITQKSAVTIDVYPGVCCKKEYSDSFFQYINKINNVLELGTFKVNDTNTVYLHYVAYFSNGVIKKELFDDFLHDAIEKINNYKGNLDKLSHGDVEPLFENLDLEAVGRDALYSKNSKRKRNKKPRMTPSSGSDYAKDEDSEKQPKDKKEIVKELWHELRNKRPLSKMREEIEEELEKDNDLIDKEKSESEEKGLDLNDWLMDFDMNDNESKNQEREADEKPFKRFSPLDDTFDIDFSSFFESNDDANNEDEKEQDGEITFKELFPEDLEDEE